MTRLLLPVLLALALPAVAGEDFRCLKAVGGKSRLQFTNDTDTWATGWVLYKGGSGRIPIKLESEKERRAVAGRPSEFESRWTEQVEGGGTYVLMSQGARIYEFAYVRRKDGRTFKYEQDDTAWTEKGCDWK